MRPAFESADDLAGMMSEDDFAVPATWVAAGGEAVDLSVIMDAGHVLEEIGMVPVSSRAAVIHVMDHGMPAGAAQGDVVTVGGETWTVRDIRPDGTGVSVVILELS